MAHDRWTRVNSGKANWLWWTLAYCEPSYVSIRAWNRLLSLNNDDHHRAIILVFLSVDVWYRADARATPIEFHKLIRENVGYIIATSTWVRVDNDFAVELSHASGVAMCGFTAGHAIAAGRRRAVTVSRTLRVV